MAATTFQGPIQAGTSRNVLPNVGTVVLSQQVTITQNSTNAVSATLYVPAHSRIERIVAFVDTAFDSATSAVLSVGTAAAGTQYASSIDVKTGGKTEATASATQSANMADTGAGDGNYGSSTIVATVTPTGATTAGKVRVIVQYTQPATLAWS